MLKVAELLKATGGKLVCGKPDISVRGISTDSRSVRRNETFLAIKGENFDGHNFMEEAVRKGASCIIKEKRKDRSCAAGYPLVRIEVKDTTKALGDIARFQREKFDIPVIAVTGSNGKTTTKEMISWVLSKKYKVLKNPGTKNNHIGLPQALLNLDSSHDLAVLEVGTNHFGEVAYLSKIARPNIAVITNIGHSHLESFKDLKGVFSEKYTLMKYLKDPSIAVLNADDALLDKQLVKKSAATKIFGFGIKKRSDFWAYDIRRLARGLEFSVNKKQRFSINSLGRHNIYNALIAISLARLFGIEYRSIIESIADFILPQDRLNLIELNKVNFINDSYNSNPVSLESALEALGSFRAKGRKIFVMGDMLELGVGEEIFHRQAGRQAARICDVFITVGERSKLSAQAARIYGLKSCNIYSCSDNLEARKALFKQVFPGPDDIVLVKGSRAMKMEEIIK